VERPANESGEALGQEPGPDGSSQRELVEGALDLVDVVLAQLRALGITAEADDLRGYGRQGLIEAAARFEPARGFEFRQFAYQRVRGAMIDGLRKMGPWSRRGYERIRMLRSAQLVREQSFDEATPPPRGAKPAEELLRKHMAQMAAAMATGLFVEAAYEGTELVSIDDSRSAEDMLGDRQLAEGVRRAVAELPEDEAEVIRRYYLEGQALDEVAGAWGCSRSWVSRVHTRAVGRLAKRLRSLK
jgi:RNA polymerase sigma factor for flagellar operon FliA